MKTFNTAAIQAGLQNDSFKTNISDSETYIRFQLTKELPALLSMKQVQGSMVIRADKITFMPGMPTSVIGIIGYRDRVFCVFDLAQLLGFTKLISPRQYQIIILQTADRQPTYVGFAVNSLKSVVRLTTEQISLSLEDFPSTILPYLCGAVLEEKITIPILEFQHILSTLDN